MKKVISLLFVFLMCILLAVPCFASDFANPPIVDNAEYLNESQLEELSEKLEVIRQKYDFDVAIVTDYDMTTHDMTSSIMDIYEDRNYGAGENNDGIILYICSSTREYRIAAHAYGETVFNENGIEYIEKKIEAHLKEDDYYLAMDTFITVTDELLAMAENGEPFNKKQYDIAYVLIVIGVALLLPLIIAYLSMRSKLSKMKTAVANDFAANYIKPGSKTLDISRDIYLYSHITKTENPKNNTSGNHKSSSGKSYNIGGGKF